MTVQQFPGLVLAGGLSRRMGSNKALSLLGDQPLLAHVISALTPQVFDVAINCAPGWAESFGLPIVPDTKQGHAGPLAGVLAGLRHTQENFPGVSHLLTVPADSPFFPANLATRLAAHLTGENSIVIAASSGQVHPVFCLWPVAIAGDLENWLEDDSNRRIRSFLARHQTLGVSFPAVEGGSGVIDPFFNVNTPDELATAQTFLESQRL